jgi:hypothetical protein
MLVGVRAVFNNNVIEHIQDKVFWIGLTDSVRNLKTSLSFYKSLYGFSKVLNFLSNMASFSSPISVKLCRDLVT